MKRKNIISLTIFISFCALSLTGVLLYFKFKPHFVEITHTLVGLLFTGFAIYHIVNNWGSVSSYTKEKKTGKIQKEFIWASAIAGIVIIGGATEIFEPIAEFGAILKKGGEKRPERLMYEIVGDEAASNFKLMLEKARAGHEKPVSIWIEDLNHKFLENVFVNGSGTTAWQKASNGAGKKYEGKAPEDGFVLNTNINSKAPFILMVESAGKVFEANIMTDDKIQNIDCKADNILKSVIVAIK